MLFVNCGAWCRDHGITPDQLRRRGVEHGVIWQSGEAFGDGDCIRINAALPHTLVREAWTGWKNTSLCERPPPDHAFSGIATGTKLLRKRGIDICSRCPYSVIVIFWRDQKGQP